MMGPGTGRRKSRGDLPRKGSSWYPTENRGLSAAQNHAYQSSQGDYIQWLDADDLLAPDKIERQLAALREADSRRILLSSPWAPFYYRTRTPALFTTPSGEDLSPVEWLLRKMRRKHPYAKRDLAG